MKTLIEKKILLDAQILLHINLGELYKVNNCHKDSLVNI